MSKLKRILGVAAVVADLILGMTGCVTGVVDLDEGSQHSGNVEVSATYHRTLAVGAQETIRVTGANGSVRIVGVPGVTEVVVDAVRRVRSDSRPDAEAHLAELHVAVHAWPQEFEIKTVQPIQTHGRSYIVDYDIMVPTYFLSSITNGNGSVQLEGLQADTKVRNGNGNITLAGLRGSSWVTLGNGEIRAWTTLPLGGQIVYAVGNGTIELSVQPQVSAYFGAKVGNGSISVVGLDFSSLVSTQRLLTGVLGTGQGLIDLSAENGQIRVQGG